MHTLGEKLTIGLGERFSSTRRSKKKNNSFPLTTKSPMELRASLWYTIRCDYSIPGSDPALTPLTNLTNDLFLNLDSGQPTIAVLDFSEAFDEVSHKPLFFKLSLLNTGKVLQCFKSLLLECRQFLNGSDTGSSTRPVLHGAPQVRVRDALLFLVYLNDLLLNISSIASLCFDDCVIYRKITTSGDLLTFQDDLSIITDWCTGWGPALNADK